MLDQGLVALAASGLTTFGRPGRLMVFHSSVAGSRLVEVLITSRLDGSKFDQLACGSSVRLEMMTGLLHVFHDSVAGTHSSMILVGRVARMSEVHVGHINRMV